MTPEKFREVWTSFGLFSSFARFACREKCHFACHVICRNKLHHCVRNLKPCENDSWITSFGVRNEILQNLYGNWRKWANYSNGFSKFCQVAVNYWGSISKGFWFISSVPKTLGRGFLTLEKPLPICFSLSRLLSQILLCSWVVLEP